MELISIYRKSFTGANTVDLNYQRFIPAYLVTAAALYPPVIEDLVNILLFEIDHTVLGTISLYEIITNISLYNDHGQVFWMGIAWERIFVFMLSNNFNCFAPVLANIYFTLYDCRNFVSNADGEMKNKERLMKTIDHMIWSLIRIVICLII